MLVWSAARPFTGNATPTGLQAGWVVSPLNVSLNWNDEEILVEEALRTVIVTDIASPGR